MADNYGYFWAVTEAKVVEGSAVVKGSNAITPVISIVENSNKEYCDTCETETDTMTVDNGNGLCKGCGTRRKEAAKSTSNNEPSKDTQEGKEAPALDWSKVISNF